MAAGLVALGSLVLEPSVLGTVGALSGTIITPDLDVDAGCIAFKNVEYAFGKPLATFWRLFWYPYALIFAHRSILSHFPIISTLIRVLYMLIPLYGLFYALGWDFGLIWDFKNVEFLFGLVMVDTIHYFMDILPFWRNK